MATDLVLAWTRRRGVSRRAAPALASAALAGLLAALVGPPAQAQGLKAALQQDPACRSLTPVSAGGRAPKDPDTLVIRWLSLSNYELVYRNQVFLLDAYYDQVSRRHPIGVALADITRANALFIGHAHFDRIADAPAIARATGATIVGAEAGTTDYLKRAAVPAKQVRAVRNGDVLEYAGVAVEAVLGSHGDATTLKVPPERLQKQQAAIREAALQQPLTEPEQKRDATIRARSSADPRVLTDGVMSYLFTFGGSFRVLFADTNGGITDAQRQLAQRVPGIDVAMLPYIYFDSGIPSLVDLVSLLRPSTLFLNSHDGIGTMGWASNYPAALAVREASPTTRTMDVVYRTPVCVNTRSKDVVVGW